MESKKRSIAKSFTWRVFSFLTIVLVTLIITGSTRMALGVGIADAVVKTVIYYLHERWWSNVEWGRMDHDNAKTT